MLPRLHCRWTAVGGRQAPESVSWMASQPTSNQSRNAEESAVTRRIIRAQGATAS